MEHAVYVIKFDDLMRKGCRQVIEAAKNLRMVGEASASEEAVEKIHCLALDLMVTDVEFGGQVTVGFIQELEKSMQIRRFWLSCYVLALALLPKHLG